MLQPLLEDERPLPFPAATARCANLTPHVSTPSKPQGQVDLFGDRGGFAWPMGGPDASEAVGLGLDDGAECIVAKGALLLEVNADVG